MYIGANTFCCASVTLNVTFCAISNDESLVCEKSTENQFSPATGGQPISTLWSLCVDGWSRTITKIPI